MSSYVETAKADLAEAEQRAVLEAIDRELAQLQSDYAQNVLRLAEAYAWLAGTGRRAG